MIGALFFVFATAFVATAPKIAAEAGPNVEAACGRKIGALARKGKLEEAANKAKELATRTKEQRSNDLRLVGP